jgi:hypothetical protein
MHNAQPKLTVQKIAEQSKVNPSTVQRAEKFAEAVDIVAENTGINPQKILSEEINSTRKDIQDVSKMEPAILVSFNVSTKNSLFHVKSCQPVCIHIMNYLIDRLSFFLTPEIDLFSFYLFLFNHCYS